VPTLGIVQNKAKFPVAKMIANCFVAKGLRGIVLKVGREKQSQNKAKAFAPRLDSTSQTAIDRNAWTERLGLGTML
jgi:hypothetical protein